MDTPLSVRDDFERLTSRFVFYQFLILVALVGLSVLNEVADLPHLWFGAPPTAGDTRWAEILIEAAAFGIIAILQILFLQTMRRKIRVLHGLIPICKECHKVHHHGQWLALEEFIADQSMAFFHHKVCPQCDEARQSQPGATGPEETMSRAADWPAGSI